MSIIRCLGVYQLEFTEENKSWAERTVLTNAVFVWVRFCSHVLSDVRATLRCSRGKRKSCFRQDSKELTSMKSFCPRAEIMCSWSVLEENLEWSCPPGKTAPVQVYLKALFSHDQNFCCACSGSHRGKFLSFVHNTEQRQVFFHKAVFRQIYRWGLWDSAALKKEQCVRWVS